MNGAPDVWVGFHVWATRRAIPEKWLVLFTHDHHTPMAKIEINEKGKPSIAP